MSKTAEQWAGKFRDLHLGPLRRDRAAEIIKQAMDEAATEGERRGREAERSEIRTMATSSKRLSLNMSRLPSRGEIVAAVDARDPASPDLLTTLQWFHDEVDRLIFAGGDDLAADIIALAEDPRYAPIAAAGKEKAKS